MDDGRIVRSKDVTGEPQEGFTVAILGDTSYCAAAVELAQDADILVHEATFDIGHGKSGERIWPFDNRRCSTVAQEAGARMLIANHISARFMPSDVATVEGTR